MATSNKKGYLINAYLGFKKGYLMPIKDFPTGTKRDRNDEMRFTFITHEHYNRRVEY